MSRARLDQNSPTIRFDINWPAGLLHRIDDYRYTNRIPSRAEAIRLLIEAGLTAKTEPE